jgi:Flp pilus assembly protein TadB
MVVFLLFLFFLFAALLAAAAAAWRRYTPDTHTHRERLYSRNVKRLSGTRHYKKRPAAAVATNTQRSMMMSISTTPRGIFLPVIN